MSPQKSTAPEAVRSSERNAFLGSTWRWIVCAGVAWIHVLIMLRAVYPPEIVFWVVPLVLVAPGLLTMALLRGWGRWYRWAAIAALALSTYADVLPAVMLVAQTWALHRQWVTERTIPMNMLFRRKPRTALAPAAESQPETVKAAPETADV